MQLKVLAAAIVGAAIVAPACALAATQIETATIPTASVPYTFNFTLPSFDSHLGTLTSVTFNLTDTSTAAVEVLNTNGVAEAFTGATSSIPLTVTGPGGLSISDTITAGPISGMVDAANGAIVGQAIIAGVTGTHSVTTDITTGLSAFESSPVVELSYLANVFAGTYGGTAAPGVAFSGTATAGGTFEIIYNYTAAVPEPATWAMLLLGVAGVGAAMRRRRDELALAAA